MEVYRVDLGLPELRWGVEYKGRRWHTAATDVERDVARVEWLERCRGYVIDELDHRNVFGSDADAVERLRAGFEHARETFASRRRRFWVLTSSCADSACKLRRLGVQLAPTRRIWG
ncbi:hypothetical protein [Nocardioides sp. B-3]|uniref:hypothetical protein n=1 Tax=Nocardioides sp. B-3 TaxID=2895565 RepID=UPI0021533009|nr:hypothetical protein [Nocardioides sp. B-3]UUZ58096.1 hypothetical protein LP418_17645 [Nocardioides sp. B-3]